MPGFRPSPPRTLAEIHDRTISKIVDWMFVLGIVILLVIGATSAPARWTGPAHHHAEVVMP